MTTLAQGARMRCDKTGCDATATIDQDAWSFCAQHAGAPVHHRRPRPSVAPPAPLTPVPKPVVDLDRLTPEENRHGIRPAEHPAIAGPIGLLLEQASGHSIAKVRRAAGKIETQLDQLRTLIAELAEDENRRQADAAAKAKAKADIARLEQQLAAAKAALRGKPAAPAASVTEGRSTPMVCRKGCGKVCAGAQGRAGHERHCRAGTA